MECHFLQTVSESMQGKAQDTQHISMHYDVAHFIHAKKMRFHVWHLEGLRPKRRSANQPRTTQLRVYSFPSTRYFLNTRMHHSSRAEWNNHGCTHTLMHTHTINKMYLLLPISFIALDSLSGGEAFMLHSHLNLNKEQIQEMWELQERLPLY